MGVSLVSGFWDFRRQSGVSTDIRNKVCRNVLGGRKAVRVDLGGVCKEACWELWKGVEGWLAKRNRKQEMLTSAFDGACTTKCSY